MTRDIGAIVHPPDSYSASHWSGRPPFATSCTVHSTREPIGIARNRSILDPGSRVAAVVYVFHAAPPSRLRATRTRSMSVHATYTAPAVSDQLVTSSDVGCVVSTATTSACRNARYGDAMRRTRTSRVAPAFAAIDDTTKRPSSVVVTSGRNSLVCVAPSFHVSTRSKLWPMSLDAY